MASDQMEYCGDCENKEKCEILLRRGEDPHCPHAG